MWPFFNPTFEVVTFRLRGWCMLDVFLLPAFSRLGHECQDLFCRVMECMCAQTRLWFILSSERVLGEWSQNPCWLQRPSPPLRRIEPTTLHQAGQRAQHTTNRAIPAPASITNSETFIIYRSPRLALCFVAQYPVNCIFSSFACGLLTLPTLIARQLQQCSFVSGEMRMDPYSSLHLSVLQFRRRHRLALSSLLSMQRIRMLG